MISKSRWQEKIKKFEEQIGYRFKKKEWLWQAISHPSYFYESRKGDEGRYEVMEFLGDAILGFLISEMAYKTRLLNSEGEMSRIKSHLVSRQSLCDEAKKLKLGQLILIGKGEEKTGGRKKESILAATMEAVIAGIYLDGGMRAAKKFITGLFAQKMNQLVLESGTRELMKKDSKSALQEFLQKRKDPLPEYVVVGEEGPAHKKRFSVEIRLHGRSLSKGEGRSKKEAEQKAAKRALAKFLSRSSSQRPRKKS